MTDYRQAYIDLAEWVSENLDADDLARQLPGLPDLLAMARADALNDRPLDRAYAEGQAAYADGDGESDNPYPAPHPADHDAMASDLRQSWADGWNDALEDDDAE